ncbi:MAG: TfoX family protein [Caldilinea sp. CFX5]|nr:TfoX family protein [Caldilinea sp. CFX5]
MAYNTTLATRVRSLVAGDPLMVEKKMFGGLGFILQGNMACGIHGQDLVVRLSPTDAATALDRPGARIFDITGRPMKGWLLVAGDACTDDTVLQEWVEQSVAFARTLPPK